MFNLQSGTMDNFVVNNKLSTAIIDDQGADTSTTVTERFTDPLEEVTLADNW
jgi:hypothetical protein